MAVAIDQKYKDGYVPMTLPNVKVQWAHLIKPDTAFGGNKWCMDILLDDQLAADMQDAGFNVRNKEKDGKVIATNVLSPKKECVTAKGPQTAPTVVGMDGKTPFTEELGNGSTCNVKLSARAWKVKGSWVLATYIEAVQVVEHVARGGSSFEDLTGGDDTPKF